MAVRHGSVMGHLMEAQTATQTHYCKFPNCTAEASSPVGRYSYCKDHQNRGQASPAKRPTVNGGTTVKALQQTMTLARQVDRARAKAEKATRAALQLKAEADALERTYNDRLREIVSPAP